PSYHVMRLYAHHFKPLPLQILLSADAPDLFACASETKSAVVIFGVNSANEPVKASFQFSGFAKPIQVASAEAVCDTLDARQPDVMNHWNVLTRVSTRPLEPASNEVIIPAFSVVAIECAAF
ncbi:MAG TPA: hypothetical protein VN578_04485, partial [Candidatus Binatia bacterium]|nr:hypothetical protein [Candidatus Binatia bacterium]